MLVLSSSYRTSTGQTTDGDVTSLTISQVMRPHIMRLLGRRIDMSGWGGKKIRPGKPTRRISKDLDTYTVKQEMMDS